MLYVTLMAVKQNYIKSLDDIFGGRIQCQTQTSIIISMILRECIRYLNVYI